VENWECLKCFLAMGENDFRVSAEHISLFAILISLHNGDIFEDALLIEPKQIICRMRISYKTYRKYIKELHEFGYIRYYPSYDPKKNSEVFFVKWN